MAHAVDTEVTSLQKHSWNMDEEFHLIFKKSKIPLIFSQVTSKPLPSEELTEPRNDSEETADFL